MFFNPERLENQFAVESELLQASHGLLKIDARPEVDDDKERQVGRERLGELGEELVTYVYYATTVLEHFRNTLSETAITGAGKGGHLDDLARARQVLAVNPGITRSLLNAFRGAHKLPTSTWPSPSSSSNGKPGGASSETRDAK